MEKISSIIPSNARVTAVDLKNSGSARPGAPAFGRQPGVSTLSEMNVATTAGRADALHSQLMDARTKEKVQADMAKKLSDSFFLKRQVEHEAMADMDFNKPIETPDISLPKTRFTTTTKLAVNDVAEEDLDKPEIGRYLDVNV